MRFQFQLRQIRNKEMRGRLKGDEEMQNVECTWRSRIEDLQNCREIFGLLHEWKSDTGLCSLI